MIKYEAIGKRLQNMSTALNYEEDNGVDVLGQAYNDITKGAPETAIEKIQFNPNSAFAKWLDRAIEREYELDKLQQDFAVVNDYKRVGDDYETGKPMAWKQKANVMPDTAYIDNKGLIHSCNIKWVGAKTFGVIDKEAAGDKFVPETTVPTENETFYKDGDAVRSDSTLFYVYDDGTV